MKTTNKTLWQTDFAEQERKAELNLNPQPNQRRQTKSSFLFEACAWLLVIAVFLSGIKASFTYMDKASKQAQIIVSEQYVKLYADTDTLMKGKDYGK